MLLCSAKPCLSAEDQRREKGPAHDLISDSRSAMQKNLPPLHNAVVPMLPSYQEIRPAIFTRFIPIGTDFQQKDPPTFPHAENTF